MKGENCAKKLLEHGEGEEKGKKNLFNLYARSDGGKNFLKKSINQKPEHGQQEERTQKKSLASIIEQVFLPFFRDTKG